jgi:hypothetical protein
MNNYTPFLKLKVNEIGALKALSADIKDKLLPFFDLVRKNDMTAKSFQEMVNKAVTSVTNNLAEFSTFFLDNFDIEDKIIINKENNYGYVIKAFSQFNFIPVVGLDRAAGRNQLVFDYKSKGVIKSDTLAIRLVADDFKSFELVEAEIENLFQQGKSLFNEWILILDNRVCLNVDTVARSKEIVQFLKKSAGIFDFDSTIITGSSIPSSIRDILATQSEASHVRKELIIYHAVAKELDGSNLFLGDYTIISPLYSDLDLPPEMLQNVLVPKIVYTHHKVHYVERGGALKTHARGSLQYNDIAKNVISKPFYRGKPYSFGDEFLHEKAHFFGKSVTPSSILKPTINTHLTYMVRDYTA